MGSYQHFKDDFLLKLYRAPEHKMQVTIGSLSREFDIPGPQVRVELTAWVNEQLILLKVWDGGRMCPLGEWRIPQDFFSTPSENPQIQAELLPRGEDYAMNLERGQIGFRAPGN